MSFSPKTELHLYGFTMFRSLESCFGFKIQPILKTPEGLYNDNLEYNRNVMEVLFEGIVSVSIWNSEGVQLLSVSSFHLTILLYLIQPNYKAMAFRQILYHIVFRTKYNIQAINQAHSEELYRYIWGVIKNKNSKLFRINGVEDHIHILSDLHPSIALADFIKDIKVSSSKWLKSNENFPRFKGWAKSYCALTYSYKEKLYLSNYIKNQQEHHKRESFRDEINRLFKEHHIEDKEGWFWKDS